METTIRDILVGWGLHREAIAAMSESDLSSMSVELADTIAYDDTLAGLERKAAHIALGSIRNELAKWQGWDDEDDDY